MTRAPRPAHRMTALVAAATAAAVGVAGCSSSAKAGNNGSKKVAIVAYSVPKPAYDALETAFQATAAGKGVAFSASYGASGTQSKSVASGQPADVRSAFGERLDPQAVWLRLPGKQPARAQ